MVWSQGGEVVAVEGGIKVDRLMIAARVGRTRDFCSVWLARVGVEVTIGVRRDAREARLRSFSPAPFLPVAP